MFAPSDGRDAVCIFIGQLGEVWRDPRVMRALTFYPRSHQNWRRRAPARYECIYDYSGTIVIHSERPSTTMNCQKFTVAYLPPYVAAVSHRAAANTSEWLKTRDNCCERAQHNLSPLSGEIPRRLKGLSYSDRAMNGR
jgi:hypothetical protein